MLPVIVKQDLINAHFLLFGSDYDVSIDFLKHIDPSVLKAAYRKRAFETHPDRSIAIGKSQTEMSARFIDVKLAYETLNMVSRGNRIYIAEIRPGVQLKHKDRTATSRDNSNLSDHYYRGHMPNRKLLIGQFLYYSGIVTWRTLIKAIIWQKRKRPPIGRIAVKWGILSSDDIKKILKERSIERNYNKKFGEYAWLKGYITSFERMALLGKQRNLQSPIGEYFIKERILNSQEIDKIVRRLRIHNR